MTRGRKTPRRKTSGLRSVAYFGFAVAGVLLILMVWSASRPKSPSESSATTTQQMQGSQANSSVPPYFASAASARPFPKLLPAVDFRRDATIERAYAVAAQIPGILAQQPCYCHCNRIGHRSLLDCYASEHAAGCDICLMEALFASQMTQRGQGPATIREEITRGEWRDGGLGGPLP